MIFWLPHITVEVNSTETTRQTYVRKKPPSTKVNYTMAIATSNLQIRGH